MTFWIGLYTRCLTGAGRRRRANDKAFLWYFRLLLKRLLSSLKCASPPGLSIHLSGCTNPMVFPFLCSIFNGKGRISFVLVGPTCIFDPSGVGRSVWRLFYKYSTPPGSGAASNIDPANIQTLRFCYFIYQDEQIRWYFPFYAQSLTGRVESLLFLSGRPVYSTPPGSGVASNIDPANIQTLRFCYFISLLSGKVRK